MKSTFTVCVRAGQRTWKSQVDPADGQDALTFFISAYFLRLRLNSVTEKFSLTGQRHQNMGELGTAFATVVWQHAPKGKVSMHSRRDTKHESSCIDSTERARPPSQ